MTVRQFLAVPPTSRKLVACCRDGTYNYWCPLNERWVYGAASVPEHALIVLPAEEEARVRRAMWQRLGDNPERSGPTTDAASKPDVAGSADAKLLGASQTETERNQ